MISKNPFSPSFGVNPDAFYGRKEQLSRFGEALDTPGSAYRFFFLTGTRGSGKTSLLHQYGLVARERRWETIRATSVDALEKLAGYAGVDAPVTKTRSFKPAIAVEGLGSASLGEATKTTTKRKSLALLGDALAQKIRSQHVKRGLAVIIDESQKLSRENVVRVATAVQDCRVEGLDIALVFGGLPSAYPKLRAFPDCTFVRRMKREKLWTMTRTETLDCLRSMFAHVPEISIGEEQLYELGAFTGGHPYLLQLVGDNVFRAAERELDPIPGTVVAVPGEIVAEAEQAALAEYKANVLDDVLRGVHGGTLAYIEAAFELRDSAGVVEVGALNRRFGKTAQQMSTTRAHALNTQVIREDGRGRLKFALPHYRYIFDHLPDVEAGPGPDEWDFG